ncbi:MAG: hypothetical protein RIR51_299 [Bacteroidota bacterium]
MRNNSKSFFIILGIGIAIFISSFFIDGRIDLSQDKRFTLALSTKGILENLKAPIHIKFFLNGDNLPSGFKRLRNAGISTMEDFQKIANQKISIEFIDIYKDLEKTERDKIIIQLDSMGIHPTNIIQSENGQSSQTFAMPGLLMSQGNREFGLLLLKGNQLSSPEEILNQSIEQMEYQMIQGIKILDQTEKKNIGFLFDYGTYSPTENFDLINSLQAAYNLYPVDLDNSPSLDGLDAICLINPIKKFSENSLYKIDQFLLKGGKAVFFQEGIQVDTVQNQGIIITEKNSGLEEFYFRLGLRLNNNLLKDIQLCGAIPLEVGNFGNQGNLQLMPWPAFPLLLGNQTNIITKNLDAVYTKFGSSIDTIPSPYQKTILLHSSNLSQTMNAPSTLPFASSAEDFNSEKYKEGEKFGAVMVEGKFDSYFKNRILPDDSLKNNFIEQGIHTGKLVLIGNSSMTINALDPNTGGPLELGFDLYSQHRFANKDFIINLFNYLIDENNSLLARNKEFNLRPLDKGKISESGTFIRFLNIILPIILTLLIGAWIYYHRKQKYST